MFQDCPQVSPIEKHLWSAVLRSKWKVFFGNGGFEIYTSITGCWMRRSSANRPQKLCCTIVGGQYLRWVRGSHITGEWQRTWSEFKWVCGLRELKRCGNLWKMIVAMLKLVLLISVFKLIWRKVVIYLTEIHLRYCWSVDFSVFLVKESCVKSTVAFFLIILHEETLRAGFSTRLHGMTKNNNRLQRSCAKVKLVSTKAIC